MQKEVLGEEDENKILEAISHNRINFVNHIFSIDISK